MNRFPLAKVRRLKKFLSLLAAWGAGGCLAVAAPDFDSVTIQDVPGYSGNYVRLTVGLDGKVFLASGQNKANGVLWILDKEGKTLGFSEGMGNNLSGAASNSKGRIALAVPHVVHSVIFYDSDGQEVGRADDYTQDTGGGGIGYNNPPSVWAGKSGKFYGYDLYGKTVRVYSPEGTEEKKIPLRTEQPFSALNGTLFADEENQRFLVVTTSAIAEFAMDGNETSFTPVTLLGPVTMNENGQLYHFDPKLGELHEINSMGESLSTISLPLKAEEGDIDHAWWWSLAVHGDEVFLRKGHPTVLFHRYKLSDGSPVKVVEAAHEKSGN
jgi:hypothetical protein